MLIYGSENWAQNRSERKKAEAAEMRFLRRVPGYTLTDHTAIRNALQVYASEQRIQDCKNKWHIHTLRLDSSRLAQMSSISNETDE
jgi:hypothetical protein